MTLQEIIERARPPEPWAEGENIPWDDPGFSRRMLKEHLSQEHDAASRRAERIDQHVAWIHRDILGGRPSRVLDLGCGPGLYTTRLARLGHRCRGIDVGPASIAYADEQAAAEGLAAEHVLGDIRTTPFGEGYDLIMQIYGEFNVFRPEDAANIVDKCYRALTPGGRLLLEVSTPESLYARGTSGTFWFTSRSGLFSDRPHLCLSESFWDAKAAVTTTRYFVVDATSGQVERWAVSYQQYTVAGYREAIRKAGFSRVRIQPGEDDEFLWILAQR